MISYKDINKDILKGLQENYGSHVVMGEQFSVTPNAVQVFEEKKRQEFTFLNEIDFMPTENNSGQIISFVDGDIVDQSRKSGGRNPIKTALLADRVYQNRHISQDVALEWAKQVAWGAKKEEYYKLWRAYVLRKRARGTLRVGFWGQKYLPSNNSDLATYAMGEDVQAGWLQYMIYNYPQNVIGIEKDNVNGTIVVANGDKYKVVDVNVGTATGWEFANFADLTQYMRDKIEIVYRGDTGIKAIVGDSLRSKERRRFLTGAADNAEFLQAAEALLAMNQIANMSVVTPDEFPVAGLMVTNPKNLQYIYQTNSVYREFREWSDTEETQDLLTMDRDFVVPVPEACVMVHPDAVKFHNGTIWASPDGWSEWSIV